MKLPCLSVMLPRATQRSKMKPKEKESKQIKDTANVNSKLHSTSLVLFLDVEGILGRTTLQVLLCAGICKESQFHERFGPPRLLFLWTVLSSFLLPR